MAADEKADSTPAGIDIERFFQLAADVVVGTRADGGGEPADSALASRAHGRARS